MRRAQSTNGTERVALARGCLRRWFAWAFCGVSLVLLCPEGELATMRTVMPLVGFPFFPCHCTYEVWVIELYVLLHGLDVGEESLPLVVGWTYGHGAEGGNAMLEVHVGGCNGYVHGIDTWRPVGE